MGYPSDLTINPQPQKSLRRNVDTSYRVYIRPSHEFHGGHFLLFLSCYTTSTIKGEGYNFKEILPGTRKWPMIVRLMARQQPGHESSLAPLAPSVWTLLPKFRPFVRVALVLLALLVLEYIYGISEGLLSALDRVHVLELGRNKEGELLW